MEYSLYVLHTNATALDGRRASKRLLGLMKAYCKTLSGWRIAKQSRKGIALQWKRNFRLFSKQPTAELRFFEDYFRIEADCAKFRFVVGYGFGIHTAA